VRRIYTLDQSLQTTCGRSFICTPNLIDILNHRSSGWRCKFV